MERRVYVVLFIAVFASTMGVGFIGPLLPLYARDLGAGSLALGAIFAAYSLARVLFMPIIGRLSDRFGRRLFLTTGLAVYTLFSLAYIRADVTVELIIVRALHGAAAGMVIPVAQAYVGELAPKGSEGSSMGKFMISLFAAFGMGPLLGGPLAERLGMHAPFYAMGIMSALAFLLALIFLPELGLHKERWQQRVPVRFILGHTAVIALVVFRSSVAFGRGLVVPFLPLYAESVGATLSMIGVILATNIFVSAFMQYPFGKLADRVPRAPLVALGIIGSAATIFFIPYCETVLHLFLLQIATGITSALGLPAALAMATGCGRRLNGMGTVMAVFNSGLSVGLVFGSLAGGVFKEIFGLDFVFQGGSLVVAAGFLAFLLLIRKARISGELDCGETSEF